jgi:hypothetical protein
MDVVFLIDIVIKAEIVTEVILVLTEIVTEIVTEVVLSDSSLLYCRLLEHFMSSLSLLYTHPTSYK